MRKYKMFFVLLLLLISILPISAVVLEDDFDIVNLDIWEITADEKISNENTSINYSVTIKSGGKLEILNSTIWINSSVAPVFITVEKGGLLLINDSKFTLDILLPNFGYDIEVYGSMLIENSDFYYLGYLSNYCTIDTCSGTEYQEEYSAGIGVHSDDVEIYNSRFNYARNNSIYIQDSSPTIVNNTFYYNVHGISILNSKVELNNNSFHNNLYGFQIYQSEVILIGSAFVNSEVDVYSSIEVYDSNITIENSNFKNDKFFIVGDSELNLYNSSITNTTDFYLYNVTGKLINNTFLDLTSGISLSFSFNVLIKQNSILGSTIIVIYNSYEILIDNNSIQSQYIGISAYGSYLIISNNTITNANSAGISLDLGMVGTTINSNFISENSVGITLIGGECNIINNTIVENNNGISYDNGFFKIKNNIIANNRDWGINYSTIDPELSGNSFSTDIYEPNGKGRLQKSIWRYVRVSDTKGNKIIDAHIEVFDKNNNEILWRGGPIRPDNRFNVPVNITHNSGVSDGLGPFTVTASWGDQINGYTKKTKVVELFNITYINLTLPLPDLYITGDDLKVSNTKVKHGETVNIELTVHYYGVQVPAKNITVIVKADDSVINRYHTSFEASLEPQEKKLQIPWKVKAFHDGSEDWELEVRVESTDPKWPLENQFLGYEKNNSASITIEVTGKKFDEGGSWLSFGQFCILVILIVIILIIIILLIISKIPASLKKSREKKPDVPRKTKKTLKEKLVEERRRGGPGIKW